MVDHAAIRSLGDILRVHGIERPDEIAFQFEGRTTSYAALDAQTNRVAHGLAAAGLRRGDRIAYLGKNSDRYFELLFGAAKAGVVMTPINWRLAGPEMAYILGDSGARALFVGAEFLDLAEGLLADATAVELAVGMEGERGLWRDYEAWRDGQPGGDPAVAIDWNDVALQLYTSGTTGRPKGAMLPHRALLELRGEHARSDITWNKWTPQDVSLVAMPVAHIGGSAWGITTLYNSARGVVTREFDPHRVLDFIAEDRISKIFMVPAAMQIVVRHPKASQTDFSCLKYILYGASPIPLALLQECMTVFGCGFVQMYGMTETAGTIVALPPEDHDPKGSPRMRSAGKALPGVELAIVDEAGRRLAAGEIGEIATRSASNMAGYWNLPDASAATLGADGWLRTGDAGYLDADGYLFIHDRVKDMIISGGENVYPAEVENAIYGCPGVAEVAVIGVPDAKWGEAVKAVVVRRPEAQVSETEVIRWARDHVAGFKTPKSVDFIEALPRNASGKVLRRELRAPYWVGVERAVN